MRDQSSAPVVFIRSELKSQNISTAMSLTVKITAQPELCCDTDNALWYVWCASIAILVRHKHRENTD